MYNHINYGFLLRRPCTSTWIKWISDEVDIITHVIAPQLSGHIDVISNRLWRHPQNLNRGSGTRDQFYEYGHINVFFGFETREISTKYPCRERINISPLEHIHYSIYLFQSVNWDSLLFGCSSAHCIFLSLIHWFHTGLFESSWIFSIWKIHWPNYTINLHTFLSLSEIAWRHWMESQSALR